MATKWQKSCVEALITSPTAFKLFRAKQVGVKMMDQYINKIWPYKMEKEKKFNKKQAYKYSKNQTGQGFPLLLELFEKAPERYTGEGITIHPSEKRPIIIDLKRELKPLIDSGAMLINQDKVSRSFNNLCYIKFIGINESEQREGSIEHAEISGYCDRINIFSALNQGLKHMDVKRIEIMELYIQSEINGYEEMMNIVMDTLKTGCKIKLKKSKSKYTKPKILYKSVNVGIEIEYDGLNCQSLEKKLLSLGAVSFHSGWDGSTADGHSSGNRLRENRLRLQGLKRIEPLYVLLEKMKECNSKPAENSGMHYHIDCRDKKEDLLKDVLMAKLKDVIRKLTEDEILYIDTIFGFKKGNKDTIINLLINNLKRDAGFGTIEWRMGTPTLNYKQLVLEILTCIHLTQCAKYKNKKPNEEYLRMLGELASER